MPGKGWTKQIRSLRSQFRKLKAQVDAGTLKLVEVPKLIKLRGRTVHGIRTKLVRIGLIEKGEPKKSWDPAEVESLVAVAGSGIGAKQLQTVSGLQGRSRNAIAKRKSRLAAAGRPDLVDPKLSHAVANGTRLRGDQLRVLEEAIQHYGAIRPTEWFEWKFGLTRGSTKRRLEAAGMKIGRKEVLAMECSRARRRRRLIRDLLARGEEKRNLLKQQLEQSFREISEAERKPKARSCQSLTCELASLGPLYASRKFFERRTKKRDGDVKGKYWSRLCLHCLAKTRSAKANERKGHTKSISMLRIGNLAVQDFADALAQTAPKIYSASVEFVLRRVVLERAFFALSAAELLALAEGVVSNYLKDSRLNTLFSWLEECDFNARPELRNDIWELDELVRSPEFRGELEREFKSANAGAPGVRMQEIALYLYRIFGLPGFVRGLI